MILSFLADLIFVVIALQIVDRETGEFTSHILIAAGIGTVNVAMAMGLIDKLGGGWMLPAMFAVNTGLVVWWNKANWLNGLIIAAIAIGAKIALALALA